MRKKRTKNKLVARCSKYINIKHKKPVAIS